MKLFLLIFSILLSYLSIAQYSNNKQKFIKEFSKSVSENTTFDFADFIKINLTNSINNDFSEDNFIRMVNTSNEMLKRGLKPYPHIFQYVFSFYKNESFEKSQTNLDGWHIGIDKLLAEKNLKRFKEFLEFSNNLYSERIIENDQNYQWLFLGGTFNFKFNKHDPSVDLSNGKLICRTINRGSDKFDFPYSDSIVITNTSGNFEPLKKKWLGYGGKLTWEKVGLSKTETYAQLEHYFMTTKSNTVGCDTVTLITPYIDKPLKGKLLDRAQKGGTHDQSAFPYPQFISFQKQYTIKNIIDNVDYYGGFSLEGNEFVGIGNEKEPASMLFYKDNRIFIKSEANKVSVGDKILRSDNARTIIYVTEEDTITHPGLSFIFSREKDELELTRGNTGISVAPFVNSYHKLDMYVEKIIWNRKSEILDLTFNFSTSEQQRIAKFESFDFYDAQLFEKQQSMERINPLRALYNYGYKYDKTVLTTGEAATSLNKTIEESKGKLLELAALGFIAYDMDRDLVTLKNKIIRFVEAREGKKDYDYIAFTSDLKPVYLDGISPEQLRSDKKLRAYKERMLERNRIREKIKSFGSIDLQTMELKVVACDNVPISHSKNTMIFPENAEIIVKKNRDFDFTGWINAGKWEVRIQSGDYDYKNNKFNIQESDIAFFRSNPIEESHGTAPILIGSSLSGVKGELFVDHLENRSGNKPGEEFDKFPILDSKEKTRVYYNYKTIHLGAYDSARFYFELDPFILDSLHAFNERALRLTGELSSGGIFPKFRDSLRLMADYSLGFKKELPKEGLDFYNTGGKYHNKIMLSNNGLQGAGDIKFITSTSRSKNLFTFLPDSTIGPAIFTNEPQEIGVEYPEAYGEDVLITYLPRKRMLKARSNKELIKFFGDEADLKGSILLKEDGMTGNGFMTFSQANLFSENFSYTRWNIKSDTSYFKLKNKFRDPGDLTQEEYAFQADNVVSDVSFKDRIGNFKSNIVGESIANFPMNRYICKIDMFKWLLDNDELELKSADDNVNIESDLDLETSNFFSVDPKRDSLNFRSGNARFSVEDKSIYCYETKFVQIADSRFYPDSMTIIIREKGKMEPLTNAKMVPGYITKYHEIIEVNAEITAKNKYKADGKYKYIDIDSNVYYFDLTKIYLDSSMRTIGIGKVESDENFKMSSEFDFYGDITLIASEPYLEFKGATRINHNCDKFARNWMAFSSYINPKNIQIPVSEKMNDLDGTAISAGILWRHSTDPNEIKLYPTFLSSKLNPDDPVVIKAHGWLQYNRTAKEYQIGTQDKLINRGEKGNFLALHTESCSLDGDGKIDLGMDYGDIESEYVGVVNYNASNQQTTLNLTAKFNFPFDEKIFEDLAKKINETENLKQGDFRTTTLEQAIMEWDNQETADKIKSDYTLKSELTKVPKCLQQSMVVTGLKLVSLNNSDSQGLKSTAEEAVIVNFYNQPVMKYVPMKNFFEQRTTIPDRLGLLMDVPGGSIYFFDYDYRKNGTMNILSNDQEFNNQINTLKADKRKIKKFVYQTTTSSTYKSQFLRVFE